MADPADIERVAEALLEALPKRTWDGRRLPIPVDAIADDGFGLLIREVEDMSSAPGAPELDPGQTLSGLLLVDRKEIWVDAEEARQWPGRRRFTIGHELGHWILHRDPDSGAHPAGESLFCRHASISEDDSKPAELPAIEDEANTFAAALLMPRELMRRHYERLRLGDDCFGQMCQLFGASQIAMGKRLHSAID